MASILSTTSSVINVGCYALLNDDYVAAKVPNLRWVLASHAPTRSTIADVNQWVGCASLLPTPSVKPHSQFNHASAAQALKQQITTFGAIRTSATIKTSKCSYKVALKHAALCKTLTAAFATNYSWCFTSCGFSPHLSHRCSPPGLSINAYLKSALRSVIDEGGNQPSEQHTNTFTLLLHEITQLFWFCFNH